MKQSIVALSVLACLSPTAWSQSKKVNFDFGWKFMEQDVAGAQAASFDDTKWQSVDLPHDWDIFHAPNADAPTGNGGGYFPGGTGWYRKQVKDTDL